ncbi:endoribonuclease YbeY isoform X4 [Cinclus cinclus]|uniref:endoribonuclease YbeY isoform X4 n=1 Tax=Cinclus cinclus TaxID=127875 RepID=UPI002E0F05FD
MSVVLRNVQRVVPVRRAALRRAVCALRAALGASRFDVGLVCAGNALMQRLNGDYRHCPEPTDVLSFPLHQVTAAHGLCHLLGYRHDTKPEWEQMYQKEAQILQELNRLAGSRLRPLTAGLF